MSEIDDILATLGAKLDGLDLTDKERVALHAIFEAAGDEAQGFGDTIEHERIRGFSGTIRNGGVILWRTYMPRFAEIVEARICPTCGALVEACWCPK